MRVVVAPDKFKGSLRASEVAAHLAIGIKRGAPAAEIVQVPVADGGEGTLDAASHAGFELIETTVTGPTGERLASAFAVRDGTALIEMAAASGLSVLPGAALDPLRSTSRGTGDLILAALDHGRTSIVLGVGGSACTDGGSGLLAALGARLITAEREPVARGGAALRTLDRVDLAGLDARLETTQVVLASDVDNPLLGPDGAAVVYGPQKGASPGDVLVLESGLVRWVDVLAKTLGEVATTTAALAGAGAAGGVGYAVLLALHAERRPGIDVVLDLVDLQGHLADAELVITGEGALDKQTLRGKAPIGVAQLARVLGVPVIAVAGRNGLPADDLAAAGFASVYALTDLEPDLHRCMSDAAALLERLGERLAEDWLRTLSSAKSIPS